MVFLLILCTTTFVSCTSGDQYDEGPSPAKTPEEEQATFQLEPGLKIELVASEPMIQDPVVITFDADGRLWVVEMRGFMPDIDGEGEKEAVGRVSILEDTDGDGKMDKSTVYLDSLLMPRALAIVKGGALVVENLSLWLTQDTDNDLIADTKVLIDADYAGSPLPEHSGNGLWRGLDNWYYNAKSRFRYRLIDGHWVRDSTEFRGQWGISHDDEGRLYYNYNWSQLHADLVPPNYLSRNKNHKPTTGIDHGLTLDRRVYPIRSNPAVNRGYIPGTLDQSGRLLEFTAACSPLFYRGTALPAYRTDVFVCEPSGNLIKRNNTVSDGSYLAAVDPHPGQEFLASTDERFRPVYLTTGPDGALYVADMYRGLVQHGAHVTPYLREQTLSRKLVLPVNRGRIWRIVPDDFKQPQPTRLSKASAEELVEHLSSDDGWIRDMAQKTLVERQDTTAVHLLQDILRNPGSNPLARLHALWTLEGLHALRADLLLERAVDSDEAVRCASLRLLEPFADRNVGIRNQLNSHIRQRATNASEKESLQLALTASVLGKGLLMPVLHSIIVRYDTSALMRDAILSSLQDNEFTFLQQLLRTSWIESSSAEKEIFIETLTGSIVTKGNGRELANLMQMIGRTGTGRWPEKAMLTSLVIQARTWKGDPVALAAAPPIFSDAVLAKDSARMLPLMAMFEWPGHKVDREALKKTTLSENDQRQFVLGRQHYLTTCAGCHGTDGAGLSRFAPPLAESEWVLGDERRLALLLLHGLEGPVEVSGKLYDVPEILPVMPAHSVMDDRDITAIMTYIRNEWGNSAPPASARVVGMTRHTSQGRVVPWTASELNQHMQTLEPAGVK
jgi:glucose/arabinose dehydrogenase/mono/diheme cytochrome c family protein